MIRLGKYLADSGLGTRSDVRSLVRSGSVLVNGTIEKDAGRRIDENADEVICNGKSLTFAEVEYYMLNKPAGIITASRDKKEKTVYVAHISGELPEDAAEQFKAGIDIGDEKPTKPAELRVLDTDSGIVEVVLTEGRYHEIKRMFEALGCHVEYLKRISMGSLVLDETLGLGEYRELTEEELKGLHIWMKKR